VAARTVVTKFDTNSNIATPTSPLTSELTVILEIVSEARARWPEASARAAVRMSAFVL